MKIISIIPAAAKRRFTLAVSTNFLIDSFWVFLAVITENREITPKKTAWTAKKSKQKSKEEIKNTITDLTEKLDFTQEK